MECRERSLFSIALNVACSLALCTVAPLAPASAQIIPDSTLGAEGSVVTPNININGIVSDRIDGGAIRGANLFHSFQDFNVSNLGAAYFTNPSGIENILSRITGSNPSHILGTLGVLGNANLFLINPNGIIFGANSRLDMGGSFVGTTADSVVFDNGVEFSATNPQTPPLLSINIPIGLRYRTQQPGAIVNAGNLTVQPGQNITLVGGSVATTGELRAAGGQIGVVAVPSDSLVQLGSGGRVLSVSPTHNPQSTTSPVPSLTELINAAADDTGLRVTSDNQVELKDSGQQIPAHGGTVIVSGELDTSDSRVGQTGGTIAVLGHNVGLFNARINASGEAGGGTVLMGGNYQGQGPLPNALATYVAPDVTINADAMNSGKGGLIVVWAEDSTKAYGTLSATGGTVSGNGGLVETSSRNFLDVAGIKVDTTAPNGLAGTWLIDPRNIIIQNTPTANGGFSGGSPNVFTPAGDDSVVSTQDIEGQLNAGTNVTITTGSTGIQEGNITVANNITKTTGGAATLTLEAANNITFNSGVEITSESDALNLVLTADSDRSGAGDWVATTTTVQANGGQINLTANAVTLQDDTSIRSDASGTSNGGVITVNARSLSLVRGSSIYTDTNGENNAGQIIINADIVSSEQRSGLSAKTFGGTGDSGQITLNADVVSFKNQAGFGVETYGDGNAGQITINAGTVSFEPGTGLSAFTLFGNGNAGQITLNASAVSIKGEDSDDNSSGFGNFTLGSGKGGLIAINTDTLTIQTAGLGTFTGGSGNAGEIRIKARSISLTQAGIDNTTFGTGNGGQINISADSITLVDSGITSQTFGEGDGGQVNITANSLTTTTTADAGGGISTQTSGSGNGGEININVDSLIVQGSGLSSQTSGEGNGGEINVKADYVLLEGDEFGISTDSRGSGKGGNVTLDVGELVARDSAGAAVNSSDSGDAGRLTIVGDSLRLENGGKLNASTVDGQGGNIILRLQNIQMSDGGNITSNTTGSGDGGSIDIQTGSISLNDKAKITASSEGDGAAGNIQVVADSIRLNNEALIEANTTGGQGNINLKSEDLVMRHNSEITTDAKGPDKAGGNITIDTGVLVALEDSDIAADSADFRGGNVTVSAQGIFGTAFRPNRTPNSDITATGADSSLSGTVVINTPGVDPSRGLVSLPETVVDPNALIAQNPCERGQASAFVITGRGGLPANPSDVLSSDTVHVGLVEPTPLEEQETTSAKKQRTGEDSLTQNPPSIRQNSIVPAQGWVFNEQGQVVLTAYNPDSNQPQRPYVNPAACSAP